MSFLPLEFGLAPAGLTDLISTGTTQGDALPLAAQINQFSVVSNNSGCVLPRVNATLTVINNGLGTLFVYPSKGGQIDSGGIDAPLSVPSGFQVTLTCTDNLVYGGFHTWRHIGSISAASTINTDVIPSARPPDVTDGAQVYNVGDLWLAPPGSTQRVYQLVDTSVAGQAQWTPLLTSGGRPLDLVPGAAAAYGVVKLREAYAGNCIRVINSSAATLDIPFNASGVIDTITLDAHLAGLPGTVDIIYDHTTNALDATQTVAANRPIIALDNVNGIRVVTFDSISRGSNPALVSKFMNLPVGLSIVPRTACVFAVGNTFYGAQTSTWLTLGPSNDLLCCANVDSFSSANPCLYCGGGVSNVVDRADPAVMCWNVNTNSSAVWCNNHTQSGLANNRGSVAVTGGVIGNTSATGLGPGDFMFGGVIIYPTAPTGPQITNIRASLMRMFDIAPQTMDTLIAIGDSINAGQGNTSGRNRHNQSISLHNIPLRIYNMGISGSTVGVLGATGSITRIPLIMNLLYNASIRNFVVSTQAGINDLGALARPATAIYPDMVQVGTIAKGYGPNVRVIACTILPSNITNSGSGGGPLEDQRIALNTMIRSGWKTWADALCDFDRNPIMGPVTAVNNTALYADGTHPTALGYSYLANQHAAVVNSLLR